MSKSEIDSDGFQIVKSKHSFKQNKLLKKELQFKKQNYAVNIAQLTRQITSTIEDLQQSNYLENVYKLVSTILHAKQIKEIVCFGLGQFSVCSISRYQLAFLLALKDFCKPRTVFVHDPIFVKGECELLQSFGLKVIEQNNEGGYVISDDGITLMYLPHCPKQLTNNFLWSNWSSNLQNCVIIGNSFNSIIENNPSRLLEETVPYIYKLHPYTSETIIENNFKYTDIFNDTSIHIFSKERIETETSVDFWNKGEKPSYENNEEFITSLIVEKLNI